jgi:hypothetical protein
MLRELHLFKQSASQHLPEFLYLSELELFTHVQLIPEARKT